MITFNEWYKKLAYNDTPSLENAWNAALKIGGDSAHDYHFENGGHDKECFHCGNKCDSFSIAPSLWPLCFPQPDGTGIVRYYHVGCVTGRQMELAKKFQALTEAYKELSKRLSVYLSHSSTDGSPIRRDLREELKELIKDDPR